VEFNVLPKLGPPLRGSFFVAETNKSKRGS
jgi:hypothetical protein